GVVQVEVVGAVLRQPRPHQPLAGKRDQVRAGPTRVAGVLDAERRKRLGDLPDSTAGVLRRTGAERVDAPGAEVALGGDHVPGDLAGVLLGVGAAAHQALLLVGEGDDADGACRALVQIADQLARGHGDADAGAVVHRAGAQVPGVQVGDDQYQLVGAAAAGDLADDVLRGVLAVPAHVQDRK